MKYAFFALTAILALSGCYSPTVEDYATHTPPFDIRQYLNGNVEAWGMFVDNSGKADPMFHVDIKGDWNGNDGSLQEHFVYADGHAQDRTWHIVFSDDHHFTGQASDVVGTAVGTQDGNAADMKYVLTVNTESGSSYDMSMDDWLYKMSDNVVINRNVMRKFGIKVGELIISFHKQAPASE